MKLKMDVFQIILIFNDFKLGMLKSYFYLLIYDMYIIYMIYFYCLYMSTYSMYYLTISVITELRNTKSHQMEYYGKKLLV